MGGVDQSISAGLGGALVMFALAIALWFLARSMLGHLRTVQNTQYPGDQAAATGGRAIPGVATRKRARGPSSGATRAEPGSPADGEGPEHADGAGTPGSDA